MATHPRAPPSFRTKETLRGLENQLSQQPTGCSADPPMLCSCDLRPLTEEADEWLGRLYLRCIQAVELEGPSLTCPGGPEPGIP